MIVAAGADDRFAMPMAVTLYSALTNIEQGRDVTVYILDGGISEQNRRRLTEILNVSHVKVNLEWVRPDLSPLNGVKTTQAFSQASYLRLLMPELIPDQIDRVIYLDSDLVVEKDLRRLWEAEMGDLPALAVQEYIFPYVSCLDWVGETYELCRLSRKTPYCNAGVMLMNLKRWRVQEIARGALEYLRKCPQFVRYADQDALNAMIAGAWGLLDPKWNVMLGGINVYGQWFGLSKLEMQYAQEKLLHEPFILHFTGPLKPWRFVSRGSAQLRFFHYLKESKWFGDFEDINDLMEYTWRECNEPDEWMNMLAMSGQELAAVIPRGDRFILVDESCWPYGVVDGRSTIPFLERNGRYAGVPPDDATAIREFERLRESGATFIVFANPALWWLSYFSELNRYLRESFRCIIENDRLIGFDLRS
jgi:lipopolysaccharide biosynthesis glycosyltransferase